MQSLAGSTLKFLSLGSAGLSAYSFYSAYDTQVRRDLIKGSWQKQMGIVVANEIDQGVPNIVYLHGDDDIPFVTRVPRDTNPLFTESTEKYFNEFPIDKDVTVYANPAHPQQNMLRRHIEGTDVNTVSNSIWGLAFGLISVGMFKTNVPLMITGALLAPVPVAPLGFIANQMYNKSESFAKKVDEQLGRNNK
jgi:hypothetical protein